MHAILDRFTKKVLAMRKELGLSQVTLAELSEVSLPTIQKIESGQSNPTLDVMLRIGNSLGFTLNIEDILEGYDSNKDGQNHIQDIMRCFNRRHLNSVRQNDELFASFLALKIHYPSLFKKLKKRTVIEDELKIRLNDSPGRLIKHARICLETLNHFF